MDRFTRIFELHKVLTAHRHPVSRTVLEERMECSRATVKRAIDDLRDHLGAPVAYDRARNGYHYDTRGGDHPYQLPGLWFSGPELHALLLVDHLLDNLGPGLLADSLSPLRERIGQLLEHNRAGSPDLRHRIRLHQIGARGPGKGFKPVAEAVATRRRLHVVYRGRTEDRTTEREVSPQRLNLYRNNWYLDAWCHLREDLRIFSLDRIEDLRLLEQPAREVPQAILQERLASAYGIFAGGPTHTAVLRFSPAAARWVADERWHSDQAGRHLPGGAYELQVPYHDPTELVMDIMRYGPDVEVLAPDHLRQRVTQRVQETLGHYNNKGLGP